MSMTAPPGGGPGANVIVATNPNTPTPAGTDPAELLPQAPVQPTPAPAAVAPAPADPAGSLNLQPAPAAEPDPTDVPDYGDNGLNIAADYFVNTVGLPLDSRELTEAAKGNFALLEAKLEVLGDKAKGSAPILALAKESVKRLAEAETARHSATVAAVHTAVGGEANWKAVQHYARTNLPAEQLKEASEALSSGGLQAVAMARYLLSAATSNPSVSVQGQPATSTNAVAESLQGVAPLTREQYRQEYRKLIAAKGISGAAKSEELRALNARVINS